MNDGMSEARTLPHSEIRHTPPAMDNQKEKRT